MSLVTRCPKCQSDFMVSLEQLRVHEGLVRCGNCTHVFDGHAALESHLPVLTQRAAYLPETSSLAPMTPSPMISASTTPAPMPHAPTTPARGGGQAVSAPLERELSAQSERSLNRVPNRLSLRERVQESRAPSVLRRRAQTGAELEREPDESLVATQPEPSFYPASTRERGLTVEREPTLSRESVRDREPTLDPETVLRVQGEARSRGENRPSVGRGTPDFLIDETPLDGLRHGLWLILAVLASALLVMQLAYVYRNELVTRVPSLLPMARAACVQLKCEVTFVRHLERISIESTALEQIVAGQVDGQSSSLTLKFSMRNRYDKFQPWPHLSVELKDASGTPVIRKVLSPDLYLPTSMVNTPFGANQEVHLSVPFVVNGLQISGVQLNRFFP